MWIYKCIEKSCPAVNIYGTLARDQIQLALHTHSSWVFVVFVCSRRIRYGLTAHRGTLSPTGASTIPRQTNAVCSTPAAARSGGISTAILARHTFVNVRFLRIWTFETELKDRSKIVSRVVCWFSRFSSSSPTPIPIPKSATLIFSQCTSILDPCHSHALRRANLYWSFCSQKRVLFQQPTTIKTRDGYNRLLVLTKPTTVTTI